MDTTEAEHDHWVTEALDHRTLWLSRADGWSLFVAYLPMGFGTLSVGVLFVNPAIHVPGAWAVLVVVIGVLSLGVVWTEKQMRVGLVLRSQSLEIRRSDPWGPQAITRIALEEIVEAEVRQDRWARTELRLQRHKGPPVVVRVSKYQETLRAFVTELRGVRQRLLDHAPPASDEDRRILGALSQRAQRNAEEG